MSLRKGKIETDLGVFAVWAHEATRVFSDREEFQSMLSKEITTTSRK